MIDQILAALKISLAECKKYEDPAEYIYQLNQVLNRYKTNIYKLVERKDMLAHDAKELIQFKICAHWRVRRGYDNKMKLMDKSPTLLHINGIFPEQQLRKNREITFNKAIPIDDVVDINRIMQLKNDYYDGPKNAEPGAMSPEDVMEQRYGWQMCNVALTYNYSRHADEVVSFDIQLSALVYNYVLRDAELELSAILANRQPDDVKKRGKHKSLPTAKRDAVKHANEAEMATSSEDDIIEYMGVKMTRRYARQLQEVKEKGLDGVKSAKQPAKEPLTKNRRGLWS